MPRNALGKGSSKFRGVSWHKDNMKWRATIFKGTLLLTMNLFPCIQDFLQIPSAGITVMVSQIDHELEGGVACSKHDVNDKHHRCAFCKS